MVRRRAGVTGDLYDLAGVDRAQEAFGTLVETASVRIERIVSHGHTSPPGVWLEQARAEWVLVLAGAAGVRFEDEPQTRRLAPGDHILIAAGRRHRVEWTRQDAPTIWLAAHFD